MNIKILLGDCVLRMTRNELGIVEMVACDPPYGLKFMGKKFDNLGEGALQRLWHKDWLRSAFEVLVPGGTLKAFSGTRTMHHLAAAMDDAGFQDIKLEAWAYGCLTSDTEVLTEEGWVHYHRAKVGTLVLGFEPSTEEFSWQPVERTFEYPYNQTAFHLFGDGTDHIVSIGHRCLVQRSGQWTFISSENLAATEIVPGVSWGVLTEKTQTGSLQSFLCGPDTGEETLDGAKRTHLALYGLRDPQMVSRSMDQEGNLSADLLQEMQWCSSRTGLGETRAQGPSRRNPRGSGFRHSKNDGPQQPRLEGRGDLFQETRELLQERAHQICPMSARVQGYGPQGWIHHGASFDCGPDLGPLLAANRNSASLQPQPDRQPVGEFDVGCLESSPQAIRGSWSASPHLAGVLARVERKHYTGTVWCVKVATGAFVARRNGMAFVTGNSGFPKSLNVSKAIDKMKGAKRESKKIAYSGNAMLRHGGDNTRPWIEEALTKGYHELPGDQPATDEAKLWDGWGTALKPAWEPVLVGVKPA